MSVSFISNSFEASPSIPPIVMPDLLTQKVRKIAKELSCPPSLTGCLRIQPEQIVVEKVKYPPTEALVDLKNGDYVIRLGTFFSRALEGLDSFFTREEAEGVVFHELSHIVLGHVDGQNALNIRLREFEADRNTLQKPHLALGVRDALARCIWTFGEKWEEIQAAGGYPLFSERIDRLDGELCKLPVDPVRNRRCRALSQSWLHSVC